jgi:hypothetical protein
MKVLVVDDEMPARDAAAPHAGSRGRLFGVR